MKFFLNIIITILTIIILLFFLDFFLLLIIPKTLGNSYTKESPPIYYRFKSNYFSKKDFFKINCHQFRGKEYLIEKPNKIKRVLIFGDSTTFGMGVKDNETFSFYLEEKLNKTAKKFEVLNFGVPGYNLIQELALIKKESKKFQGNIIVLSLMANDLQESYHYVRKSGSLLHENALSDKGLKIPFKNFFRLNSYLYEFLGYHLEILKRNLNSKKKEINTEQKIGFTYSENDRIFWEQNIKKIYEFCNKNNFVLLVLLNPYSYQIKADYPVKATKGFEELCNFNRELCANNTSFQEILMKICKNLNIEVINMLPIYRKQSYKKSFSETDFVHPNKIGHQLISQELYKKIINLIV